MAATENEDKVLKVDENETSIENNETKLEENLYQQKKRKKTSVVWNDVREKGATTQYQRHSEACLSHQLADKKQKQ